MSRLIIQPGDNAVDHPGPHTFPKTAQKFSSGTPPNGDTFANAFEVT